MLQRSVNPKSDFCPTNGIIILWDPAFCCSEWFLFVFLRSTVTIRRKIIQRNVDGKVWDAGTVEKLERIA
jgi:hypothetical protein